MRGKMFDFSPNMFIFKCQVGELVKVPCLFDVISFCQIFCLVRQ